MNHIFNQFDAPKLDNPMRRKILPPKETLLDLGLKPGEIVADIGCGIGYFTFPAAEIVAPDGKVYALDVSDDMLAIVETEKNRQNIANLEIVKTDECDLKLKSGSVTFAFICDVLHHMDDLKRFIVEIRRILSAEGKLVIVEWVKKESDFGPPIGHRLASNDLGAILPELGFENIVCRNLGEDHYAITADPIL